jgi:hypothetical protein
VTRNEILELRADAEQLIKSHRPDIFMSRGGLSKERIIKRVTKQLALNQEKFQHLLRMGYSSDDVKEKARQQTVDDFPDIFNEFSETNGSLFLHKRFFDDEES